ncbi:PucR family transcriptional regulator [Rummeliibacillus pycnus]|uniref:PucR family transcriptional regulator n=1 Tax=Rummeliibacillus pycnus TaxID=101070 RepID=UPI003D27476E
MIDYHLTVRDILQRNSFKSAKVIAGFNGLNRQVKWSHILEVNELESLINGDELILMTGVGLQLDLESKLHYLQNLIDKHAACICIELGTYFREIPIEWVNLAEEHDFPIIIFENMVKFVDITQDLHTFFINHHHQLLFQLDLLSKKFIDYSLTPNGILKILQELHRYFNTGVLFASDDSKSYYVPSKMKDIEATIQNYLDYSLSTNDKSKVITISNETFVLIPIKGLGQIWGFLCLQMNQTVLNDFVYLILDRAALAIAQILSRNRTIQERKQNKEDELIQNLVKGLEYDPEDVQTYLPSLTRHMYYRIFIIKLRFPKSTFNEEEWEEIKLQRTMFIRSIFKRLGFFPAVSSTRTAITVIASFQAAGQLQNDTSRFTQVIERIEATKQGGYLDGAACSFGISRAYNDILHVKDGYLEANEVLHLQEQKICTSYFYQDLGVNRLLLLLKNNVQLHDYVNDYLKEVLNHDQKHDNDLFNTLSVYLECNGVKNETAERLFIVRQTLYNRLEKLETLLGKNFMEPSNRLALEVAIKAYKLISTPTFIEEKTVFFA